MRRWRAPRDTVGILLEVKPFGNKRRKEAGRSEVDGGRSAGSVVVRHAQREGTTRVRVKSHVVWNRYHPKGTARGERGGGGN